MFDKRKDLFARLADAVDLTIDFATLGEYGLEPVDELPRCGQRSRRRAAGTDVRRPALERRPQLAARV